MATKHVISKQILCLGSFILAAPAFVSTNAVASPRSLHAAESAKVAQLIRLMDKDKNGQVSKEEFLQFMSTEFDRLDADKSGALSRQELSKSVILGGPGKHVGGSSR